MKPATFDPQVVKEFIRRSGLIDYLSEDHITQLDLALSAIGDRSIEFSEMIPEDVSVETYRRCANQLVQIFDDFVFSGEIVGGAARFAVVAPGGSRSTDRRRLSFVSTTRVSAAMPHLWFAL